MRKLDIYGLPIELNINGTNRIKTTIGGYFTILSIILLTLYCWFFGNDLIYKQTPLTYQEKINTNQTNSFLINKNKSYFYFQIFDGDKNPFIDQSYLKLKFVTKYSVNSKTIRVNSYLLEECRLNNFPKAESEKISFLYKQIIAKRYYCPDLGKGINIFGSWIEQNITFAQILVYPCNNQTDNVVCKSREEIDDYIWNKRLYLSFYYPIISVSLNNYTDPLNFNFIEDYFYLPKQDLYKFYVYGMEQIVVKTDDGVIIPGIDSLYEQNFFFISNDSRNIKISDPYIFSIDIASSFSQVNYSRTFLKITNLMSSIGGMFYSLGGIFAYINLIFISLEKTKILTNNIFVYKNPNKEVNSEYIKYKQYNRILNIIEMSSKKVEKDMNMNSVLQSKIAKFIKYKIKKNDKDNHIDDLKDMEYILDFNKKKYSIGNDKLETIQKFLKNDLNTKHEGKRNDDNDKKFLNNHSKKEYNNNPNQKTEKINKNKKNNNELIDIKSENGLIKNIKKESTNNQDIKKVKGKKLDRKEEKLNKNNNGVILESDETKNLKSHTVIDDKIPTLSNAEEINFISENLSIIVDENKFERKGKSHIEDKKYNNVSTIENKSSELKEKKKSNENQDNKDKLNNFNISLREKPNLKKSKLNEMINNDEELPDPRLKDSQHSPIEYYRRYIINMLKQRMKNQKINLNFWEQLIFSCLRCEPWKNKNKNSYEYKLNYLIQGYMKKVETYFDFLNHIKAYQEMQIIKSLLLDDHQKVLVDLLSKNSIDIPFDDEIEKFLKSNEEKPILEEITLIKSINTLFEKSETENRYRKNDKPVLCINGNLIDIMRKEEF